MIPIKEVDKYINLVCKYIFKKGISKDTTCYVRTHCDGYCLKHFKLVQKSINKIKKEKCNYLTVNGICNRSCELNRSTCKYHKEEKKEDFKMVQNENDKKNDKKKLKKKKYKERKKIKNSKINTNIKIEFINEGKDIFGLPKGFKRKSPFPDQKIVIDNILYKNCYYEWEPFHKQVKLYCINIEKNNKKIFIYSIKQFENMLLEIYTNETVDNYFGY